MVVVELYALQRACFPLTTYSGLHRLQEYKAELELLRKVPLRRS